MCKDRKIELNNNNEKYAKRVLSLIAEPEENSKQKLLFSSKGYDLYNNKFDICVDDKDCIGLELGLELGLGLGHCRDQSVNGKILKSQLIHTNLNFTYVDLNFSESLTMCSNTNASDINITMTKMQTGYENIHNLGFLNKTQQYLKSCHFSLHKILMMAKENYETFCNKKISKNQKKEWYGDISGTLNNGSESNVLDCNHGEGTVVLFHLDSKKKT